MLLVCGSGLLLLGLFPDTLYVILAPASLPLPDMWVGVCVGGGVRVWPRRVRFATRGEEIQRMGPRTRYKRFLVT